MQRRLKIKPDETYCVVLDDDANQFRLIEEISGYRCLPFKSNEGLLKKASKLKPLAAFIDVHLDGGEIGLDVVRSLKVLWPGTVILVMSGDSCDPVVERSFAVGADDFILKPLRSGELNARLRKRINNSLNIHNLKAIKFGDLLFDKEQARLLVGRKEFGLSKKLLKLCEVLFQHRDSVVSKEAIVNFVWGSTKVTESTFSRTLHNLRQGLRDIGAGATIESVYGKGVRLKFDQLIETILVVDDNVMQREVMSAQLQTLGFSVVQAENGQDAVEKFENSKVKISTVFMDNNMPVLDGIQATQCIRLLDKTVPIVGILGNQDEKEHRDCIQAGMNKIFVKPVSLGTLADFFKTSIDQNQTTKSKVNETGYLFNAEIRKELEGMASPGFESFFHEMLTKFLEVFVIEYQEYKLVRKSDKLRLMSHKFKGMCRNIGADATGDLFESIENGDVTVEKTRSIEKSVDQLIQAIRTIL